MYQSVADCQITTECNCVHDVDLGLDDGLHGLSNHLKCEKDRFS